MPAATAQLDAGKTNNAPQKGGSKLRLLTLGSLDQRTTAAKRAAELIRTIEADLGDNLSEGQRQLVQRAAVLGTFIESCEAAWLSSKAVDLAEYLAAINSQRRVLATIGLSRVPKEISQFDEHVAKLVAARAANPPAEEDDVDDEAQPAIADQKEGVSLVKDSRE